MGALAVRESSGEMEGIFEELAAYHARFAHLFARSETREQAQKYIRALAGPVERRNGWQIAEAIGDLLPDSTQRLLYLAPWDANQARDVVDTVLVEYFGEADGVGVIDETGFVKQGKSSVGVARQYTGTVGKVTNCQVGVFLGYSTSKGAVLLDRELYLPKSWCEDPSRCRRAKVPRGTRFATKPTIASKMLARAWDHDVPMAWVTGDEVYGNDPKLRDFITEHHRHFVLAVKCTTRVWTERPAVEVVSTPPRSSSRSPRRRKLKSALQAHRVDPVSARPKSAPRLPQCRVVKGAPKAQRVDQLAAQWMPTAWQRISRYGEKGPIEYDWACARVIEHRNKLPGVECWLLVRRSVQDPSDRKYYLSDAPRETPLQTLVAVALHRCTIEQCFEEGKDDVGMDQYEVRHWHSWYRYITLCLMSLAWLAILRLRANTATGQIQTDPVGPLEEEQVLQIHSSSQREEPKHTPATPQLSHGSKQGPVERHHGLESETRIDECPQNDLQTDSCNESPTESLSDRPMDGTTDLSRCEETDLDAHVIVDSGSIQDSAPKKGRTPFTLMKTLRLGRSRKSADC
jgi:SRSO17 transposase